MGKDTKGKGKTGAKKVKGGKRAAEKQDVTSNESTDSLIKKCPYCLNEFPWVGFMISSFENYASRRLLMFLYQG